MRICHSKIVNDDEIKCIYLPAFGFALDLQLFHRKKAMAIPAIINNSVASIGAITTTSTTVIPPKLPLSDIVLALTLGTPFACDDVYLLSILVGGEGGDDDSVDQQRMNQLFH